MDNGIGERIDGVAETVNDFFQGDEDFVFEATFSEFLPDLFNRIHFGRIRWDKEKDEVFRNNIMFLTKRRQKP